MPQNRVLWTHQEPYSKAQRITDSAGAFVSGVEVEPFGLETNRSFDWSAVNQKRRFTTYDRDANGGDEAMFRRYAAQQDRFAQPDPYDGSYNFSDPQSLNRYAYVQNDPVNFVDPSGLQCHLVAQQYVDLPSHSGGGWYYGWECTRDNDAWGGFSGDKGKGSKVKEKPASQPCAEQDFSFPDTENPAQTPDSYVSRAIQLHNLSEIAQTAVGEASTTFFPGEVEAVIGIIGNRLHINQIFADVGARGGFTGGTDILGILGDFDAHAMRSGENKVNQAKAQNGGILPADSDACRQLLAAKNFARQFLKLTPDDLYNQYPYTRNLGLGGKLPKRAFGLVRIGNSRFFNVPFR